MERGFAVKRTCGPTRQVRGVKAGDGRDWWRPWAAFDTMVACRSWWGFNYSDLAGGARHVHVQTG